MPRTASPASSTSPVCRPARISRPSVRTDSTIALAERIARAGPSNVARNPSPAVVAPVLRDVPHDLEVRHGALDENEIHGPVAQRAVGEMDVAVRGVANGGA